MSFNGNSAGKTCGSCKFGQIVPQELGKLTCFGAPPTPVVIAAGRDQLGRTSMQIELIRPQVSVNERACALHEQRIHIELGRLGVASLATDSDEATT